MRSPPSLWPLLLAGLCVIDQVDTPAALVELPDGSLRGFDLRCLPPTPREGERLSCEPDLQDPCAWRFERLPEQQEPPGGAPPTT